MHIGIGKMLWHRLGCLFFVALFSREEKQSCVNYYTHTHAYITCGFVDMQIFVKLHGVAVEYGTTKY